MANSLRISITVKPSRSSTTITYGTHGLYRNLNVNDISGTITGLPLYSTASSKAFWEAVLLAVEANIVQGHGGGS